MKADDRASVLSVVTATHNRSHLLPRAVSSALDQGVEAVIVDDGSTDDTARVAASLAGPRCKYVRLETSRGPCHARNVGVRHATRDFVLFLDDDDILEPNGVAVACDLVETYPDTDVFFSNCVHSDGTLAIPGDTPPTRATYEDWLDGHFDRELKPMIRRTVFEQYRFPDTGASGEGIMWAQVIRDRGAVIDGRAIIRYDSKSIGRITSAVGLLERAEENSRIADALLEHFGEDIRSRDPRRWARRVLAAATYHLVCGRRSRARELFHTVPSNLLPASQRAAFRIVSHLPVPIARVLFVAHRRELISTLRAGRRSWRPLLSS